jgi:hypothetical protein
VIKLGYCDKVTFKQDASFGKRVKRKGFIVRDADDNYVIKAMDGLRELIDIRDVIDIAVIGKVYEVK